jgi:hypothetical protein
LDISSRQQLVRHLACSYGHSLWGCYCEAVNGLRRIDGAWGCRRGRTSSVLIRL